MDLYLPDGRWHVEPTDLPIQAEGRQWAGWADFDRSVLYVWRRADQPLVTLCRLVDRLCRQLPVRAGRPRAAGIRLTGPDPTGRRYVIRFYEGSGDVESGPAD